MKKVIIIGAAGRDFHNYNVYFKENINYEVVAFTATQIPFIEKRTYPKKIAKKNIPIYPEEKLEELIEKFDVDVCVFAYSDVSHEEIMHVASRVLARGCDFWILGPKSTMLKSQKKVVAVTGTRTGVGKSPLTRWICRYFKKMGKKVVAIRHPMPYGAFIECERFEKISDLKGHTFEEMEEYEPLINEGIVVFAGVEYTKVLKEAEKEADIIVWDGGNNDFSFIKPDLTICVADAKRAGHELIYHPGETNFRMADVIIINKSDYKLGAKEVQKNAKVNKKAVIFDAILKISAEKIKGSALVIEDGPSITHGGTKKGAGLIAAEKQGAKIIDASKYAKGSIAEVYKKYKIEKVLPAMGYSKKQVDELAEIVKNAEFDTLVVGTPIDISRLIKTNKKIVKVKYEIEIKNENKLKKMLSLLAK